MKENGRFSHNVYTLPDTKLPQTKITDTQNLVDGDLHTKKNSSKTNSSSKKNSSKSLFEILCETGYDCTVIEINDLGLAIHNFVEFRKGIKKPMTEYAIELMVKKLAEMSGHDIWTSQQILNQSIMNGWQGIFPLKEKRDTVPNAIKNRVSNVDNW